MVQYVAMCLIAYLRSLLMKYGRYSIAISKAGWTTPSSPIYLPPFFSTHSLVDES